MELRDHVKRIGKAVEGLRSRQGLLERRNALGEVSRSVRALRKFVRENYPPVRSYLPRKKTTADWLRLNGFVECPFSEWAQRKLLGVKIYRIRDAARNLRWYIPAWSINAPASLMRKLQRDWRFRQKWEVESALVDQSKESA